ncbi:hypothetical protein GY45DRAFT_1372846 [Cubamyces sp. BRFM 1775]|nr:hypothetical protein GY45DRAFT_1372846 [Cubamyces sp. BRFM 1775]
MERTSQATNTSGSHQYNIPVVLIRRNDSARHRTYRLDAPKAPNAAFANLPMGSAVERFLTTSELVGLVFEYFYPDPESKQHTARERGELRGFMLTTKAFFPHAAAILWASCLNTRNLYRLLTIMDITPPGGRHSHWQHSWTIGGAQTVKRINDAVGKILRDDISWNHFLYYASLIQVLHLRASTFPESAIPILSQHITDKSPILPALRELYWDEEGVCDNDLLFLVGSSLRVLTIRVPDIQPGPLGEMIFSSWAERLCKRLSCLCPKLTRLSLRSQGGLARHEMVLAYFNHLHQLPVRVYESTGA